MKVMCENMTERDARIINVTTFLFSKHPSTQKGITREISKKI